VKSHIGIAGNETADKTAVGVANGTLYEYERMTQSIRSLPDEGAAVVISSA
jgi:hypothetical protein